MTAAQMHNEFEIVYEAIASGDAPGYEPYEVSILLTEAQEAVIKEFLVSGIEQSDITSVIIGPFIKVSTITSPDIAASATYNGAWEFVTDISNFWLIVGERLKETVGSASIKVRPISHSFWEANVDNPYKKPVSTEFYWRMLENSDTETKYIITGPTTISSYYIHYLEQPTPIIVPGVDDSKTIDGTTVDVTIFTEGLACKYNSVIHREIVKRAAENAAAYARDVEGFQLLKAKYKN